MPIISPAKEFYSTSVRKRYGVPDSFGEAVFGWSSFGAEDYRQSVYQKRQRRGNFWTKTSKVKKGVGYCKMKYYYSPNPRTVPQQANRSKFALAVEAWQALTQEQKNIYNKNVKGKPWAGYHLFISEWLKSH